MKELTRCEWLKLRKNYIGASDAPVIMNGTHFEKTPYKLWREKLGMGEKVVDNSYMQYGRRNEEPARQAYEKYTGTLVNPEVVFHPEKKFMMASLDGLSFNGDLIVEIKCPGAVDHDKAKRGEVPQKYWAQVQHQLACIPVNQLHYFSFRDGEGVLVEVERDEDYIQKLYLEEGKFWDKVIQLEAPDLSTKDFQDKEGSQEWKGMAERWATLSQQLKTLEEDEKSCRKLLIDMAGDCSATGHGVRVTKVIRKGVVDYKAIPALIGVDLEGYRKKAIETWRLQCLV